MYRRLPTRGAGLTQDQWHKIKNRRQRLVLCRLMIDLMRGVHTAYAPASEPFGTRLETFFIGLCVALVFAQVWIVCSRASTTASECSTSKGSQWSRACIALNRASS